MQHGVPEFKVANLFTDMEILKEAQTAAKNLLEEDPMIALEKNKGIKEKIDKLFREKLEL